MSSAGESSLGGQSQIPTIRPFQLDPQGFGALMNGVNLFRGEVSLPISLASLPGRGGLKAEATILCSTNVGRQTETWNLAAPTGPAGLGWSLGYEFIALDSKSIAVGTEDVYYLVAGGATNRLYQTAVSADSVTFELEQYQFWNITYFPAEERWLIVKEDGQLWTYGGVAGDALRSPFSYLPDLVTSFDSATGVMKGRVADFYPAAEGYPYARTDYYRSPLAMTSAQSLPGRELAITADNPHVRRFIYGTNAPPFWDAQWPSGEYFVQRTIDPDGGNTFTLRTKTDQVVAVKAGPMSDGTYRTSVMEYDNAGRAVREYLPNHFGASAPPDSFVAETDYNFLGEVLELRDPDGGTTRAANDRSGQKRFSMTNAGGQTGTIVYAKYDALGRTIEQGFFEGTWNQSFLNDKASDPKWPDDTQPHTWTLRNEYDGDGSDPEEIGRLRRATTRGDGDVIQTFKYNIAGAVTGIEQTAPSFDSTPRAVGYTYNVAGDNVGLTYPAGSTVAEVRHSYDRAGNLFRLGTPQSPSELGAYEYNAAGAVQRATLDPQSARPLVRTHDYNPPGWPLSIRTTLDTATLLSESLTYTSGGYNGAAYYSGQAASITFDGSATTAYSYRNRYDRLRQLTVAQNTTWMRGAGAALAGRTRAIPTAWSEGLLAKTGRFETIYPSRLKTGWVGIFGY